MFKLYRAGAVRMFFGGNKKRQVVACLFGLLEGACYLPLALGVEGVRYADALGVWFVVEVNKWWIAGDAGVGGLGNGWFFLLVWDLGGRFVLGNHKVCPYDCERGCFKMERGKVVDKYKTRVNF